METKCTIDVQLTKPLRILCANVMSRVIRLRSRISKIQTPNNIVVIAAIKPNYDTYCGCQS